MKLNVYVLAGLAVVVGLTAPVANCQGKIPSEAQIKTCLVKHLYQHEELSRVQLGKATISDGPMSGTQAPKGEWFIPIKVYLIQVSLQGDRYLVMYKSEAFRDSFGELNCNMRVGEHIVTE